MTTGLLTQSDREFLRGERDVENPQGRRGNLRYRAKQRIEQIEEDLELLEEHGHQDIADKFHQKYSEREQLREEIESLHESLEELQPDD